ncbi:hypothetical protein NKH69_31635 [Mesorhizobium sp. M0976]|uniref:hypothetical protein n=1 Tax=Mesorhizobium sp. M0976 TaxID=2957038 RepID=UPI00333538A3
MGVIAKRRLFRRRNRVVQRLCIRHVDSSVPHHNADQMKIPVAGLDLGAINGVKDMGCSFLMGRLCAAGGSGNVSRKVLVERPDLLGIGMVHAAPG